MNCSKLVLLFVVTASCVLNGSVKAHAQSASSASLLGLHIADFRLQGVDGNTYSLSSFDSARGCIVVFSCNHCPFAKLYTGRLNALAARFAPLHVPLLVINPMDTTMYEEEGLANMLIRAREAHFKFPYLIDPSQAVARSFRAKHTPQAFVVWKENNRWVVRYAGAIDDNGEHPELAQAFVANAVESLLESKTPTVQHSASLGCRIIYRKP